MWGGRLSPHISSIRLCYEPSRLGVFCCFEIDFGCGRFVEIEHAVAVELQARSWTLLCGWFFERIADGVGFRFAEGHQNGFPRLQNRSDSLRHGKRWHFVNAVEEARVVSAGELGEC